MNNDFKYTYRQFPGWNDSCEGMKVIEGDTDNIYVVHQVVEYGVKDDYHLHIHFLFPETLDEDGKYPLIIHVRGSGWMEQNMTGLLATFAPIVKAGYGVAFVQYRPVTVARFPAQILDAKTATRFIMEHAAEYPIDVNNILLSGDSSGGHTAILAALTWNEDVLDNEDEKTPLPELCGLIDIYGVTDVGKLAKTETGYSVEQNARLETALFDGPESDKEEHLRRASAFTYINDLFELPPVLIIHGNKDRLVPLSQSVEFYQALKERNTECEFWMVNKADHGHSVYWCPAVIEKIIAFLDKHTMTAAGKML